MVPAPWNPGSHSACTLHGDVDVVLRGSQAPPRSRPLLQLRVAAAGACIGMAARLALCRVHRRPAMTFGTFMRECVCSFMNRVRVRAKHIDDDAYV